MRAYIDRQGVLVVAAEDEREDQALEAIMRDHPTVPPLLLLTGADARPVVRMRPVVDPPTPPGPSTIG